MPHWAVTFKKIFNMATAYTYNKDTSSTPAKGFVFSALNNTCLSVDTENAVNKGLVTTQWRAAILTNAYSGDTGPKTEFWIELTEE